MTTVLSILLGLVVFSFIIIFHELGHLIVAKRNGISVPEFSLGMGPKLFGFKKGETTYCVRLLLIGGACQMLGEDEKMDDERSFNAKGPWARFATIFAGPFFNFVLAFIFAVIIISIIGYDPVRVQYVYENSAATEILLSGDKDNGELAGTTISLKEGDIITSFDGTGFSISRDFMIHFEFEDYDGSPVEISFERDGHEYHGTITPQITRKYQCGFTYTPNDEEFKVASVSDDGAFAAAGIKAGDVVTAVDGVVIESGAAFSEYIDAHPFGDRSVVMTVNHKGTVHDVTVTPKYVEQFVNPQYANNSLGILLNHNDREDAGPLKVIKYAAVEVKYCIVSTVKSLGKLITGQLSTNDVGGPVRIVSELENTVQESKKDGALYVFINMANWLIILSANLGIMNLLPIPALDGGRLFFILIELIIRKPIDKKKEGLVHAIGMVLLLLLMVFIFFNDIKNVFF